MRVSRVVCVCVGGSGCGGVGEGVKDRGKRVLLPS